eukprot:scaffold56522_cov59-Attheya_sp.AAC.4
MQDDDDDDDDDDRVTVDRKGVTTYDMFGSRRSFNHDAGTREAQVLGIRLEEQWCIFISVKGGEGTEGIVIDESDSDDWEIRLLPEWKDNEVDAVYYIIKKKPADSKFCIFCGANIVAVTKFCSSCRKAS